MFGKNKVLKGQEAQDFLNDYIEEERSLNTRVGDISYQLHLINKNLHKLIKVLRNED